MPYKVGDLKYSNEMDQRHISDVVGLVVNTQERIAIKLATGSQLGLAPAELGQNRSYISSKSSLSASAQGLMTCTGVCVFNSETRKWAVHHAGSGRITDDVITEIGNGCGTGGFVWMVYALRDEYAWDIITYGECAEKLADGLQLPPENFCLLVIPSHNFGMNGDGYLFL